MKHSTTHRMCEGCWFAEKGRVLPRTVPAGGIATCCFCGDATVANIGIQVPQAATTMDFCRRNNENLTLS